jgi:hypothetical protein
MGFLETAQTMFRKSLLALALFLSRKRHAESSSTFLQRMKELLDAFIAKLGQLTTVYFEVDQRNLTFLNNDTSASR